MCSIKSLPIYPSQSAPKRQHLVLEIMPNNFNGGGLQGQFSKVLQEQLLSNFSMKRCDYPSLEILRVVY